MSIMSDAALLTPLSGSSNLRSLFEINDWICAIRHLRCWRKKTNNWRPVASSLSLGLAMPSALRAPCGNAIARRILEGRQLKEVRLHNSN
jgi:hypothetical protein